jgi:hypothetical protein
MMTMQMWTASNKEIRKHEQWDLEGNNSLSSEFNSTTINNNNKISDSKQGVQHIIFLTQMVASEQHQQTERCHETRKATIYYYYYYYDATSYYNTTINNKMNSITHLLETMHWREIGALSPSPATHLFLLLACFAFLCCV